eukprot:gnl/TRDRNA2_/TRDRNA2_151332_c0_seq1.p1 gnl/TRDRNA2_/TRDRNA2_151332_c0~~gnl/TRDRNA2_/TRDRNA2_151332_c0_seq1.p1  ORF type:complete len:192 (+),score=18.19 gnl/TRDRNA2_/TRDRNA2_151332_c0_seq1:24-578(+)
MSLLVSLVCLSYAAVNIHTSEDSIELERAWRSRPSATAQTIAQPVKTWMSRQASAHQSHFMRSFGNVRFSPAGIQRCCAMQLSSSSTSEPDFIEAEEVFREMRSIYGDTYNISREGWDDLSQSEKIEWAQNPGCGEVLEALYGEISPKGVQALLTAANAKAGEKFYDLGSGDGKAVMVAWLTGH